MPTYSQYDASVDLEALNEKRVDDLIDREPDIAVRLEACPHNDKRGLLICAVCSERSRLPYLEQLRRVAELFEGPHEIATVYLESVPAGGLSSVRLPLVKAAFRARLRRYGFRGAFLGGGVEVAWNGRSGVWTVHSHLLAIGAPVEGWTRLASALRDLDARSPVRIAPLRDFGRQISYLQKFTTYQKLYRRRHRGQPQIVPLPPERLAELARWWSIYTFDDFVFLFGARRRGGVIAPEF